MQIVFGYSATFGRERERGSAQNKPAGLLTSSESSVWWGPSLKAGLNGSNVPLVDHFSSVTDTHM